MIQGLDCETRRSECLNGKSHHFYDRRLQITWMHAKPIYFLEEVKVIAADLDEKMPSGDFLVVPYDKG